MNDGKIFNFSLGPGNPYKLGDFGLLYKVMIINFSYVSQTLIISKSGGRPVPVNVPAITALEIAGVDINTLSTTGTLAGYLITGPFKVDFKYISLNLGFGQNFGAAAPTPTTLTNLYDFILTNTDLKVTFIKELIINFVNGNGVLYGGTFSSSGCNFSAGTYYFYDVTPKDIDVVISGTSGSLNIFGVNAAIDTGNPPSLTVGADP